MFETLAHAAELFGQGAVIGAHLVSLHGSPTYDCSTWQRTRAGLPFAKVERECAYRNANPGLYLRLPSGATLGAYRNSYGRAAAYAGWTWATEGDTFALTAGVVTGYPGPALAPVVVPSMRLPLDAVSAPGWALRLSVIPKPPRADATGVLHLSIEKAL